MEIGDFFIVSKKGIFSSKNNTKYMSIALRDATGTIEGKIWDRVDELQDSFDKNDLVFVQSRSRFYQERPQLTITDIKRVDEALSLEDLRAFLPECDRGMDTLRGEFMELVGSIHSSPIASLFSAFLSQSGVADKFFTLPASVGVHHVYLGGLVEHSIAVARMAREAARICGGDVDIVVAGGLLHDIGKVDEMGVRGGFQYSDRGRLLGHIALGVMIFENLIREIKDFPPQISDVLRHIIISHHGIEEWGSPRKPMTIEALIVHYIDNLDAKVMGVREHMRDSMEDELWTTYHRLYESRFYRTPEGIHGS